MKITETTAKASSSVADPDWLTTTAKDALDELTREGRDRTRILAGLELLRAEILGAKGAPVGLGGAQPGKLPSKRQIDAAVRRMSLATEAVERVVTPFSRLPEFLDCQPSFDTLNKELDPHGIFRPELSSVTKYLTLVIMAMTNLKGLIRRNGLRDLLKAYVVVHACDWKGRWYDMQVSELIEAATVKGRARTYGADTHKDWRHRHAALIEEMKQVVGRELGSTGYEVEYEGGPLGPYKVVAARPTHRTNSPSPKRRRQRKD